MSRLTWKTLDPEEGQEKYEESFQRLEKEQGHHSQESERNIKKSVRQSSEKEMCGLMVENLRELETQWWQKRSAHRDEGIVERNNMESDRTERQEREEETPPGVGVSEMASMRVEETNMRVYTESEFKTEVVKCPALHRSEHGKT